MVRVNKVEGSLRQRIQYYLKKAEFIERQLLLEHDSWGKYQADFNRELNAVFSEIMNYERVNGQVSDQAVRLKEFFVRNFRKYFLKGVYIDWSLRKPYGYAGDFKIIDDIYLNNPRTTGYDRLFDNYFQMSSISVAVRNRKDAFKRALVAAIKKADGRKLKIMNLASGPCREIKELFVEFPEIRNTVSFDCYDLEKEAHNYAKTLLKGNSNVSFYAENALHLV